MTKEEMRLTRWRLLLASDWTQIADAPLSDSKKTEWKAYRQALRDLPEKYIDGAKIKWPVAPK